MESRDDGDDGKAADASHVVIRSVVGEINASQNAFSHSREREHNMTIAGPP